MSREMNRVTERLYLFFVNDPIHWPNIRELSVLIDGTELFSYISENCPASISRAMSDNDWQSVDLLAFKRAVREDMNCE